MTRRLVHTAALAALAALVAAGCAPSQDTEVSLAGAWPSEPGDYDDVTERWTRFERVRGDIDQHLTEIFRVHATLLSPEWRAAYVEKRAEDEKLSPARREALAASQRARHDEYYEVVLIVGAYERRLIDFHRGDDSVWRVTLVGDGGEEIDATEIERDRRLRSVIAAFFPFLGDFDEAYLARFPRDVELFGPHADTIKLVLASPLATVALSWEAP